MIVIGRLVMKIAFLPIDNRPVCYTLPKLIAEIDDNLEFFIPDRCLLGDLTKSANILELFDWLKNLPKDLDAIILTLDTIAYGGLIPSRRCVETFDEIKNRIKELKQILVSKNCKIYAFSSIMRISNNNYNEEEKEYWANWGEKIFDYSYNLHKNGQCINHGIPQEIIQDYLETRRRNFEINKIYLQWQKEGIIDTLIFSKDDCAQYGLNVMEAKELEKLGAVTKTGADEIPLSLFARAILGNLKICPIFLEPEYKDLISCYEDISIEKSVEGQIKLAGCTLSNEKDADIILYVNNFKNNQGEIVMKTNTQSYDREFVSPSIPYMIADVRFANGADNYFVTELLKNNLEQDNFYGYSGWNTSANSLGSLICAAKVKLLAKTNSSMQYNNKSFKRLQVTRFLDDWAYQANVRQNLKSTDISMLNDSMRYYENIIKRKFGMDDKIEYKFAWNRLFEVEIEFI